MPSTIAQQRASAKYRRVHKEELREKMVIYMETYSKAHYDKNRDKIFLNRRNSASIGELNFFLYANILSLFLS